MNLYSLLPLIAAFANLIVCIYILYINPKNNLNRLYGLFALSLAIWSFGSYFVFISTSVSHALFWKKISTLGAVLTSLFLFHFVLVFSKNKFAYRKIVLIPLYLSGGLIIVMECTTSLLTVSMHQMYWGYTEIVGPYYSILSGFVSILTVISLIISVRLSKVANSIEIKKQSLFLIIAIGIPLVGGIITQVIAPLMRIEMIPITSSLTTITAFVVAISTFKHSFIRPMSFSIQKKIAAMFVIFIFCLCFASIVTTNIVATEGMKEEINDDLISLAQSRANHLETFLTDKKNLVGDLAGIERVVRLLLADENSSEYMQRLHEASDKLVEKKLVYEDVLVINVLNINGEIIASTNEATLHKNKKNDELFINGMNQTFIVDVHYPCEGGDVPVYGISSPIKNGNKTLGVVLVRLSVDPLFEILTDVTGLGETGEVFLVNKTGYMITPSRFFNMSYNLENIILKQKIDTLNYQKALLHSLHSDSELEATHEEINIFEDFRGQSCIGAHEYISEMDWALLAEIDESEAYEYIRSLEVLLLVVMGTLSFIFLVLSIIYSKKISDPIKLLDSYAKEVAKGNLSVHSQITTGDEIGSLSNSFDTMVSSLKDHTEGLEDKISERTLELQNKIEELENFKKAVVGRELRIIELKNQVKQLREERKMEEGERFV